MRQISGLVLVRESGVGIPNLVVAVFDSDLTIEDIRKHELSADLTRRAGKRIGSVLTDADGRFTLPAEDLAFPGNEARPDLVIMVLAPEDVLDAKKPYPAPTEERILYVSTVPRIDAGAQEAYVIRLLQAQLDRFRIPTGPQWRNTSMAVEDLTDAVLRSLDIRDGVRERLGKRLAAEKKVVEKAREVARDKLKNFSALPADLREESAQRKVLLIRGKAQLAEELPKLQAKSIADSLSRMKKTKQPPTMRLRLSDDDLKGLGLEAKGGKISGRVAGEALNEKLHALVNTLDLVRVRPSEPALEELERRYLSAAPEARREEPKDAERKEPK